MGEPAGRQSWDRVVGDGAESSPGYSEEALSFNPSVNPNSGDKVLRAQRVSGLARERVQVEFGWRVLSCRDSRIIMVHRDVGQKRDWRQGTKVERKQGKHGERDGEKNCYRNHIIRLRNRHQTSRSSVCLCVCVSFYVYVRVCVFVSYHSLRISRGAQNLFRRCRNRPSLL